jgi:hypothetical protein
VSARSQLRASSVFEPADRPQKFIQVAATEPVAVTAAIGHGGDDARPSELAEMVRDERLTEPGGRLQLPHRVVAGRQYQRDAKPIGMAEGV